MDWYNILTKLGVRPSTAARWSPIFSFVVTDEHAFSAGEAELPNFLGQVLHESAMLERLEENLVYSPERLMAVWPKRFPTLASAIPFARNPEALAEKVYGGRMGNNLPGDGYKYRGRGLMQVTGRDNYRELSRHLAVDLELNPELLAEPEIALRTAVAWWEGNVPDSLMGDTVRITKRVNGGTAGLDDRMKLTAMAQDLLA